MVIIDQLDCNEFVEMFKELEVPHIISFKFKDKNKEKNNLLIQYLI